MKPKTKDSSKTAMNECHRQDGFCVACLVSALSGGMCASCWVPGDINTYYDSLLMADHDPHAITLVYYIIFESSFWGKNVVLLLHVLLSQH